MGWVGFKIVGVVGGTSEVLGAFFARASEETNFPPPCFFERMMVRFTKSLNLEDVNALNVFCHPDLFFNRCPHSERPQFS